MKPHIRISMAFPCPCPCTTLPDEQVGSEAPATGAPMPTRALPRRHRALGSWRLVPGRGAVAVTEWRAGAHGAAGAPSPDRRRP